jgi:hypothetical protein
MSSLKLDVVLADSVVSAPTRAQELEKIGVDGAYSFENAHDVCFPLDLLGDVVDALRAA